MLQNGLYEQVISKGLEKDISESDKLVQTAGIDGEEAAKVLSKYIAEVTEQQLAQLKDKGGDLQAQVQLVNRVIQALSQSGGRRRWIDFRGGKGRAASCRSGQAEYDSDG